MAWIFCSSLLLFACGTNIKEAGYDTKAIKEEIENRKIKRVTDIELYNWVQSKAIFLADSLQKDFINQLQKQAEGDGFDYETFVKNYKSEVKDQLAESNLVTIELVYLEANTSKKHAGKLQEVYEAYWYNIENNTALAPNLQKEKTNYFYTSPIQLGKKWADKTTSKALWQITFTKSNAIKKVNVKEIRK